MTWRARLNPAKPCTWHDRWFMIDSSKPDRYTMTSSLLYISHWWVMLGVRSSHSHQLTDFQTWRYHTYVYRLIGKCSGSTTNVCIAYDQCMISVLLLLYRDYSLPGTVLYLFSYLRGHIYFVYIVFSFCIHYVDLLPAGSLLYTKIGLNLLYMDLYIVNIFFAK